ncbi:LOW QUALITY PROTEIN: NTP pyrophosphohydrolase [Psychrobacter sp. JCM 18903]|nr:LOW QUALITY PROTEIN: NTP pyrophosphohydrolase [Psychrobacter sp. JCM 18903]
MKTKNKHLFDDFIQAQDAIYSQVIEELTQGQKRMHWMWFIFPVKGLGCSTMPRRFAVESLEQAKEYLQHDVFGGRLIECAELLLLHPDKSALAIFGSIDTLKLHSSLTLFTLASSNKKCVFDELLDQYYRGHYGINSIRMLKQLSGQ